MSILATIEEKLGRFMDRQGARVDKWLNDSQDLSDPETGLEGGPGYKHPFQIFNEMLNGHSRNLSDETEEPQLGDLLHALKGGQNPAVQLPDDPVVLSKFEKNLAQEQAKQSTGAPEFSHASSRERAERILRAIVYASRCDGSSACRRADAEFEAGLRSLNLDKEDLEIIREALGEPLEPANLAASVYSPEEALEIYAISYVVAGANNPESQAYLDRLQAALFIPEEVKSGLAGNGPAAGR